MNEKTITKITYFIVAFVALCAFALSFNATAEVAYGRVTDSVWLSRIVPLVIEVSIVAFAIASLYQVMNGESRIVSTSLVVLFTSLAITINVNHANFTESGFTLDNIFTGIIAAAPPFGLACSFEMLLAILKSQAGKSFAVETIASLRESIKKLQENHQSLVVEMENAKQSNEQQCKVLDEKLQEKQAEFESLDERMKAKESKLLEEAQNKFDKVMQEKQNEIARLNEEIEQRQKDNLELNDAMLLQYLKVNPDTSQADAARFLEIAQGTVSRKVKEFKEAGMLHKNGHGWEVKV